MNMRTDRRKQSGITKITIENFKGISHAVSIPLRPITLLFGANSAGKSTVLQALAFIREIVERHNAGPDDTVAGGASMDLGGFRNLVHKHEMDRTVRIGLEITPDEDGIPSLSDVLGFDPADAVGVLQDLRNAIVHQSPDVLSKNVRDRLEGVLQQASPQGMADIDISAHAETVNIDLCIDWDENTRKAFVSSYAVQFNGVPLAKIERTRADVDPSITEMNYAHPILVAIFPPLDEDTLAPASPFQAWCEQLEDSAGVIPLSGQGCVLPDTSRPLALAEGMDTGAEGADAPFRHVMNQILLGPAKLLAEQIQHLRYIGPIRKIPRRGERAPAVEQESAWADGSAAWHELLRHYEPATSRGDALVQEVSRNMSDPDRLGLGYELDVATHRLVDEKSALYANLQLLREQYDERDQDFFESAIGSQLPGLLSEPRIVLHDTKNQVDVEPADVGVGVIQIIPVLVASLVSSCDVLAVEQPDLHLHPAVQCRLGDFFIRIMHRYEGRLQLLETHSEHVLLRLMRRVRESATGTQTDDELGLTADDLAIVFVQNKGDRTRMWELELNEHGELVKGWPDGFFDQDIEEIFGADDQETVSRDN